jgi:capsular polysaccharide transport system permease protein
VRALLIQLQVVHALVLRETRTRFGRHRLGYLWAILEPVLFIATFGVMYSFLARTTPARLPLVPFLATGFLPYLLFMKATQQAQHAISGNKGLLFYPHVRPLDLVAARTWLEVATSTLVFALILGAHAAWQGRLRVDDVVTTVTGLVLAAGLGMGLGLVLCGLTTFSNTVERLASPLMRPLFWISALFFSTNEIPSDLRNILLYNPLLHIVELTRDGWFPGYRVPEVTISYPIAWILVLLFLGLTLERVARRRLELT